MPKTDTMTDERVEWRPIRGFEGLYEVSNCGDARSLVFRNRTTSKRRAQPLKLRSYKRPNGYLFVTLQDQKRITSPALHTLVLSTFVGPRPTAAHVCNHIDGNKKNNRLSNLEWVTPRENRRHAMAMGLYHRGERARQSKLNNVAVRCIRFLVERGVSTRRIAKAYNVNQGTIWQIKAGKTWKTA